MIDIVVTSLDGSTEVELKQVKTVKEIPISKSCVPKQVDLNKWPHLRDVCVPELEDERALRVMEKSAKLVNGHYQVALPWRREPTDIPNNKIIAESRLRSLKNRLEKDSNMFERYTKAMQEYIDKGHAQKVPKEERDRDDGKVWYLSHHPVIHPAKPEKTRIVFDCAAKFNQQFLNDHLLSGPDLTNSLLGVLVRFRQGSIAMIADIESMFYQVLVQPDDWDAFRFLWWENHDFKETPTEYRMVKHVFGATSSPSVTNFCSKKTALSFGKEFDPEVTDTVDKNMYVDDLMKSVDQTEKAVTLANQLQELLKKRGFRLTKWLSNDRNLLAEIPESERAKSVVNLEIGKLATECALGIKWNVETDKFIWDIQEETLMLLRGKLPTKRGILSVIYSLFDPLGFIAPYIMKGKLLLQQFTRKRLGWDDAINEQESSQWHCWLNDLPKLEDVKMELCFKPKEFGPLKSTQLHVFSDGSGVGYGAVVYLRLENQARRAHCSFVLGKARLAPIRDYPKVRAVCSCDVCTASPNNN